MEVVDLNQVENIFNYANKHLDGQYIVPILRDRIKDQFSEEFIEENKILELSQDDTFSKSPNFFHLVLHLHNCEIKGEIEAFEKLFNEGSFQKRSIKLK